VLKHENCLMDDPIVGTPAGLTKTVTEVANLPALDSGFGLRNLSQRIYTFLELRTETARLGNRSSGLTGGRQAGGSGLPAGPCWSRRERAARESLP